MRDLTQVAAFVREMLKEGATHVRVGEVEVAFGLELEPAPASPERGPSREELEAHNEALRFAHVEGFPVAGEEG